MSKRICHTYGTQTCLCQWRSLHSDPNHKVLGRSINSEDLNRITVHLVMQPVGSHLTMYHNRDCLVATCMLYWCSNMWGKNLQQLGSRM